MSKFQAKDEELFLKVGDHIKKYPDQYRSAGKWLDRYYGNDGLLAKKQEEIREQKDSLTTAIEEIEGRIEGESATTDTSSFDDTLHRLKAELFTKKQRLEFVSEFEDERRPPIKERLAYALEDLYRDYRCAGVLSQRDARVVLLITWVATDAEAHESNLGITKFADSPWRTEDATSELVRFGLAPFLLLDLDISLHYQYHSTPGDACIADGPTYEIDLNYLPLLHRAWRKVEANKEIDKKATQNDEHIKPDSARQWFDLEGIILRLIKARIKEEEDFKRNVLATSEPRRITSKFLDNIDKEFFSEETKAFLNRQEEEVKGILAYIAKVCELDRRHQWPSGTIDLLEELTAWESGSFKFELDDEDADKAETVEIGITGPVAHYIEEKSGVLSNLHALIIKSYHGFLTEETTLKTKSLSE